MTHRPAPGTCTACEAPAALAEAGYVCRRSAASLRTSRTHTVGVILNHVSDPFFSALLASLENVLAETGRTVFICNTGESVERQADFIRKMIECSADGLIAGGLFPGRDFALVAHEDVEATLTQPPLSVTTVSRDGMGRRAAELLMRRIESPDTPQERVVLGTRLVLGSGANAPHRHPEHLRSAPAAVTPDCSAARSRGGRAGTTPASITSSGGAASSPRPAPSNTSNPW